MNWINTTWSQQAATVQPSSPAVVSSSAATQTARQTPSQDVSHEILPTAAVQPPPPKQPQPQKPSESIEAMKSAAEQIDSYLRSIGRALDFSVDESTGRTVVTVRDSATGETIRQIPSEEALRLAQALTSQDHPAALIDQMA